MISIATKHIETAGKILPMRVTGTSGSGQKIKPVRFSYQLRYSYTIHPENGSSNTTVDTVFPGKYNNLATNPTWAGHRFLGWYTQANTPSTANVTSGSHLTSSSDILWGVTNVYANWQVAANVTFDATTNGGSMPSGWVAPEYYIGLTFGTLPIPTKSGQVFIGWYDGSGNKVVETTKIKANNLSLTARYVTVVAGTTYSCTTTSSFRNTGIYSATRQSTAEPIYIDWGDGTGEEINGNISYLAHAYSSNGTFTVKISDNINTFCPSTNNSTWYITSSHNRYTFKKVTLLSEKVSQLSPYAFYYCNAMTSMTIPYSVTSIGNNAFYRCNSLTGTLTIPNTVTSIGDYAFGYCSGLTSVVIDDGITSIGPNIFYYCSGLQSITIPNSVTSIGASVFSGCTKLATITCNAITAPTVQSNSFGTSTSSYTGRNSYSAGTNKLIVPESATGYDTSYWASVLCDSTKCGFTLTEISSGSSDKATPYLSVSYTTPMNGYTSQDLAITTDSDGVITVISNDTNIVTVSDSGPVIPEPGDIPGTYVYHKVLTSGNGKGSPSTAIQVSISETATYESIMSTYPIQLYAGSHSGGSND